LGTAVVSMLEPA